MVTGASSGIGRATALLLDRSGFEVFAGVLDEGEAAALQAAGSDRLTAVTLDVTDADSVAAAARRIEDEVGDQGLAGLVNNAGIAAIGPLEHLPVDRIRAVFEVNVFGVIAVTQAFAELLRQGRGRVVNISSVGAWIAMPWISPINASKAAVASFSDAMRIELGPSGIDVIAVEPGSIRTPGSEGMEAMASKALEGLPAAGRERYETTMRDFIKAMSASESKGSPPEVVAEAVRTALVARAPRTRYPAGANARRLSWLGRLLPNPALDRLRAALFRN